MEALDRFVNPLLGSQKGHFLGAYWLRLETQCSESRKEPTRGSYNPQLTAESNFSF